MLSVFNIKLISHVLSVKVVIKTLSSKFKIFKLSTIIHLITLQNTLNTKMNTQYPILIVAELLKT